MPEATSLSLVLMLVFIVLSAFFSSSEAAFLSLEKLKVAHLVATDVPGAARVARMIKQPERLLSTILLGNNLVNIAFTALVTVLAVALWGEGRGIIVATTAGTTTVLIFGEIIPKTFAVYYAERMSLLYARPLAYIESVFWPLVIVLQWVARRTRDLFGIDAAPRQFITEAELRTLIDIGEAEGTFEPAEAEMLENVFHFGDRQVRELMTPRTEIVSIERGTALRDFLDVYATCSHTRFPVYKGSVENLVGIISAKDILRAMTTKRVDYDNPVTDLIRDAYFVPETKQISELFDELRRSGNQMAIAVDEYGGLAGLVTLKRLSEVVVGPVGEEGVALEEEYETIGQNTYHVDGGMSVDEVKEELGIELPEGDFETIAGFVLDVLGHIPREGERFEFGGLKIKVTELENLKIETIELTKTQIIEGGASVETDPGQAW